MAKSYSDAGVALTKQFEGLVLHAYQDQGGVWTIGYGHTGKEVKPGMEITPAEALQLLILDVHLAVEAVNHLVTVPLTQNQFDALVDFAFNVGTGALANSTLLRDINAGRMGDVEAQFLRWDHVGKVVNMGLWKRRKAEAELFAKP